MAFTAYRTFVAGEIVTAAMLNQQIRDNGNYLKGVGQVPTIQSGLTIDNTGGDERLLLPLLSTAECTTVLNAEGEVAFDEQTHTPKYYNGSAIKDIGDHGSLGGLTDDDHTIYQKESLLTTAGDIAYATGDSTWQRLGIGTAYQVLRTNAGVTAPEWATSSAPNVVRKTSDEIVNNSAVLQNDDALLFTVGANEVWQFMLYLRTRSASATPDIDYAFTIPAAGSLVHLPNWTCTYELVINEGDGTTEHHLADVANANRSTLLHYLYIGGANAGTVQLQWAQNVATAEDTKVLANSYIIAHQLA